MVGMGRSSKKPINKAYEQRPAEVRQWLDEDYPQIDARIEAQLKKAAISHLGKLQKLPQCVRKYFELKSMRNAA